MQPDTEAPAPPAVTSTPAPRIMVWHIRPPATADETLNRVIILPTSDDDEAWEGTEINVGAPVL